MAGNVRELENFVERSVILTSGNTLRGFFTRQAERRDRRGRSCRYFEEQEKL